LGLIYASDAIYGIGRIDEDFSLLDFGYEELLVV
jgi:hypothetical protein